MILLVSLIGRFIRRGYKAFKELIFLKALLKNTRRENEQNYILVKSKEKFVFTAGLFHPQIFISQKLIKSLSQQELKVVMLHESYHKKEYDPMKIFIANLIRDSLPYLPGKKALFENFEILSELCADSFSEYKSQDKRSIISALLKLIDVDSKFDHLAVSSFNLRNDRIKILLGRERFKFRGVFTIFILFTGFFLLNMYILNQTNIFLQCQHIMDCFNVLISHTGSVSLADKQVCMSSDSYASTYHCVQFSQSYELFSPAVPASQL